MKIKSTKRALIASALSLLLCISMLVGTTFAWFTDSVTSGRNTIQSGNLDVELEYSLDKGTTWAAVTKDNDIFGYDNWEPGFVKVIHFRVTNKGSLALKYRLTADVYNETAGINKAGEEFYLSEYLYTEMVETDATREEILASTTGVNFKNIFKMKENSLAKNASETVAIAIWMPTTVGNAANHNGTAPKIEFGINLVATQMTAENDSFGIDYDAFADYDGEISNAASLQAAFTNGGTYKLVDDVAVNANTTFSIPEGITVNLDLAGKKITGGNNMNVLTKGIIVNNGELTLAGGGEIKVTTDNAYSVIDNYGTLTLNDITIDSTNYDGTNGVPMYAIRSMDTLIVNDGAVVNGLRTITINDGTAIFNGGKITTVASENVLTVHTVYIYGDSTATFNAGTFKNLIPTSYASSGGAATICDATTGEVVINGGYFESTVSDHMTLHDYGWGGPTISVKGGTFKFKPADNKIAPGYKAIAIAGGYTVIPDTYEDIAGYEGIYKTGTNSNINYYVYTAEGFAGLNKIMNDKSAGQYAKVELMADVDMTGKPWTPVDSHADTAFFLSSFNGNGHTISNLTINGQAMFTRFAGSGDVEIRDVTFDNATVNSNSLNSAIITGHTYQNILLDNVDVKNSSITGSYKVAPLIATVYNESSSSITATIKNCDVSDTEVTATTFDFFTCGMVSFVYVTDNDFVEYENCTVTNVKLFAPNVYSYHAAIHYTSADTDDCINEADGVTVTNVTFENI